MFFEWLTIGDGTSDRQSLTILILDEPTVGLDPVSEALLLDKLLWQQQGKTTLISPNILAVQYPLDPRQQFLWWSDRLLPKTLRFPPLSIQENSI